MPDMNLSLTVNESSHPAYKIIVNDGGPDGGNISEIYVGGFPGTIDPATLDAAVQTFANALAAAPGFAVMSITKLTAEATQI
ncbi:hypothetical protein ABZ553_14860 [Streptomyces sparsogenes]|uniref:hypothetical protein n=1 Tax=Streptomyces sparsogenes TaxID=67365 RepID=UPI0033FAE347